jgi:hypothetical protein
LARLNCLGCDLRLMPNNWVERFVAARLAEHDERVRLRRATKTARAAKRDVVKVARERGAEERARLRKLRNKHCGPGTGGTPVPAQGPRQGRTLPQPRRHEHRPKDAGGARLSLRTANFREQGVDAEALFVLVDRLRQKLGHAPGECWIVAIAVHLFRLEIDVLGDRWQPGPKPREVRRELCRSCKHDAMASRTICANPSRTLVDYRPQLNSDNWGASNDQVACRFVGEGRV